MDNICIPCRGTGNHMEFKCPVCDGPFFGSFGDLDKPLMRYCQSSEKCRFKWMEYEDFRFINPTKGVCIICGGTGKETLIGGKATDPSV